MFGLSSSTPKPEPVIVSKVPPRLPVPGKIEKMAGGQVIAHESSAPSG